MLAVVKLAGEVDGETGIAPAAMRAVPPQYSPDVLRHLVRQVVGPRIVVAVAGSLVQDALAERLVSPPVVTQRLHELSHRHLPPVEHKPLHRRQGIGHDDGAHGQDLATAVTGTAPLAVEAALEAVINEKAAEELCSLAALDLLPDVALLDDPGDSVFDLGPVSCEDLIERGELRWVAGLDAEQLARLCATPVVECQFQALGEVDLSVLAAVVRLAADLELDAPAHAVIPRVAHRHAAVHQRGHHRLVVRQ